MDARCRTRSIATVGQHGLDVDMKPAVSTGYVRTGFARPQQKELVTKADKDQMREPIWVYRFWRRRPRQFYRYCQFLHADRRVDSFFSNRWRIPSGRTLQCLHRHPSTRRAVSRSAHNRPAKHTPRRSWSVPSTLSFSAQAENNRRRGPSDENGANLTLSEERASSPIRRQRDASDTRGHDDQGFGGDGRVIDEPRAATASQNV